MMLIRYSLGNEIIYLAICKHLVHSQPQIAESREEVIFIARLNIVSVGKRKI